MSNGLYTVPTPVNEPVLSYAPGSAEKAELKAELARQASCVTEIPAVINGTHYFHDPKPVFVPHQREHCLAQVHHCSRSEIDAAITGSLAARQEWAALPWEERAAVFLKAAELLRGKYRAAMNAATMLGQSKTVHQSEIDSACELIDFFRYNVAFMQRLYTDQPTSAPGQWNRLSYRGLEGFVYAITPFNFSSIAINLATAPALMGCSVIWKPAHQAMASAWVGMQLLTEAGLPPGVINLIPGEATLISQQALQHRDLAGIHFTGSTAVFNTLWQSVGQNIGGYRSYPRLVGETGGKDFILAHPSADQEQLLAAILRGAFEYQGQKCSAASRLYVPQSIWSSLKKKLIEATEALSMGSPSDDFRNFLGAVIDQRAYERIKQYIDFAKTAADAKIIAGGQCEAKTGYFIRPTIIETTNPHFKTMLEEIFGPVLTVYVYADHDLETVLNLVDQSAAYALTGAIFAQDRRVIHHLCQRLEHAAGNFYINDKPTGAVVGQQPFGGARASGTNDKAGSVLNLTRWTSARTIKENFQPVVDYKYPFMGEA